MEQQVREIYLLHSVFIGCIGHKVFFSLRVTFQLQFVKNTEKIIIELNRWYIFTMMFIQSEHTMCRYVLLSFL